MSNDTLWQEIAHLGATLADERVRREAADDRQQTQLDALAAKPNLFSDSERAAIDRLVRVNQLGTKVLALAAAPVVGSAALGFVAHHYHLLGL